MLLILVQCCCTAANTIGIPKVELRFQLFEQLSDNHRLGAQILGYYGRNWDLQPYNEIERRTFNRINIAAPFQANTILTRWGITSDQWDCWINHFGAYRWNEMTNFHPTLLEAAETLGWDKMSWTSGNNIPESEFKNWTDLSIDERLAAEEFCFVAELWDGIDLRDWAVHRPEVSTSNSTTNAPVLAPSTTLNNVFPVVNFSAPAWLTAAPVLPPSLIVNETSSPLTRPVPDSENTSAPILGVPVSITPPPISVPVSAAPPPPPVSTAPISVSTPTQIEPVETFPPTGENLNEEIGLCFSGANIVQVQDERKVIPMSALEVGDFVLAENNKYERVYSFGHRDETRKATFLRLLPSRLEISKDHMVFVVGRSNSIPASMLKVGDALVNSGIVQKVEQVVRTGLYTPFTPSGTIIVNKVLASNYISFQGSDVLKIGTISTPLSFQWLAQSLQVPHRIWCHWLQNEDKLLPNGFSEWSAPPFRAFVWIMEQHPILMGALLLPILTLLFTFALIESLLPWAASTFSLLVVAVLVTSFAVARKDQRTEELNEMDSSDANSGRGTKQPA